ncbi:MAG: hypothetical protein PHG65_07475 [Kiritimatiellae bacterium]|nr:hypothetical protein [Kiritimatiellia bacterium]
MTRIQGGSVPSTWRDAFQAAEPSTPITFLQRLRFQIVFRSMSMKHIAFILLLTASLRAFAGEAATPAALKPISSVPGYLARLLINETPFPGEHGWISEADTKAAMLSILWVLHSRIAYIPPGYSQSQIAAVRSKNIVDVITAGGEKGQCDGFFKTPEGAFTCVARVQTRVNYLLGVAGKGAPGRFARLLNYAQGLATAYVQGGIEEADRFAGLRVIGTQPVTGRAYSWMADADYYAPGGDSVKIPDAHEGSLGGNRFFTLEQKDKKP